MSRTGIFISYRRDDTAGHAGRLYDGLVERFGESRVFMDVGMEPGVDFVDQIERALDSCAALLVLIGPEWLEVDPRSGGRRLDAPGDFVRMEVARALRHDIRVIPLLVQGAAMPAEHELPDDLARLARRNALELSDARWRYDVARLADVLQRVLDGGAPAEDERRHEREKAGGESRPAPPEEADRSRDDARRAPAAGAMPDAQEARTAGGTKRRRQGSPGPPRLRGSWAVAGLAAVTAVVAGAIVLTGVPGSGEERGGGEPDDGAPAVVSLGAGSGPDGIAVDDGSVWVAESKRGTIVRIDRRSGRLDRDRIPVGDNPDSIAVSGASLWVTNTGDDEVVRLSSEDGDGESIPVGASPEGIAVDGESAWVANSRGRSVTRIAFRGLEREEIGVGAGPQDIVAGAPGIAWVSNAADGSVTRISLRPQDERTEEIRVGGRPRGIAKGADGRIWVADAERDRVVRIGPEVRGRRARRAVRVGAAPVGVAIADGIVWVTNSGDKSVTAIDEESLEVLEASIPVGDRPLGVAARDGVVWVTNFGDGTVSRLESPFRARR